MRLVKFTDNSGDDVYVNPEHVISVTRKVITVTGEFIVVQGESTESIVRKLTEGE